jgi:hypothetical protein
MICAACCREARGFGYDPLLARRLHGRAAVACSMQCLGIVARANGMIDPTRNERAAMQAGGDLGGQYLDSIGKTDLSSLTPLEWRTFVEAVVTGFCDYLRDAATRDRERLDGMPEKVPY